MKVFVTGATGFIGSEVVKELLQAGHQVVGLARNEAGAASLLAAGAEVHRGDIEDVESLRSGVKKADAVIHTAFNHDFSKFAENCETDRRAIAAMGEAAGTAKLFMISSGTAIASAKPGTLITEDDGKLSSTVIPRAATEEAAAEVGAKGGRVVVVRLPQVHNTEKQGLVTYVIEIARQRGVSAYVGDGANRWPAAHRSDVARLYRLALEKNRAGAVYNAVAEEGVAMKAIAEVVGAGLRVPVRSITAEEAKEHFGWMAHFVGWDIAASSAKTRKELGWEPTGVDMITDLKNMKYV